MKKIIIIASILAITSILFAQEKGSGVMYFDNFGQMTAVTPEASDGSEIAIVSSGTVHARAYIYDRVLSAWLIVGEDRIVATQIAHNLSAGDAIRYEDSSTSWQKANAERQENTHTAFVGRVFDADNFLIIENGIIKKNAFTLIQGKTYYLDERGELDTLPAYVFEEKVFTVLDATTIMAHGANTVSDTKYQILELDSTLLYVENETSIAIKLTLSDASNYTVDWGDGNSEIAASGANVTHTYASSFSGNVKIKNIAREQVESVELTGAFFCDFERLQTFFPYSEQFIAETGRSKIYGDLSEAHHKAKFIDFQSGMVHGDVSELMNDGLERLRLVGAHRVTWNVSKMSDNLDYVGIINEGNVLDGDPGNYITGRFTNFSTNLNHLDIQDTENSLQHDLYIDFADFANNVPNVLNLGLVNSDFYYTNTTLNYIGNPRIFIAGATNGRHLTTQEIDDLLADLATFTTWDAPANLFLTGHDAPSAAGNASIVILENNGVNVTINSNN